LPLNTTVQRHVLIAGARKPGQQVPASVEKSGSRFVVRGFLDNDEPLSGESKGRLKDLTRIDRAEFVDKVFVTTSSPREAF
jgi:hypothetical protein